jgi:DNA-binding GntR family transcriptional regulator
MPGPLTGLANSARNPSVYEVLKEAVLSGELAPGQQLVETALADWLHVSRTPIREALTRLEQDGLVGRTARGLVVRELSPDEILDIYETREILETAAARLAAERRTDRDLSLITSIEARAREIVPDGTAETVKLMAETNRRFHVAIWRATHNESLIDLLHRVHLHLTIQPATTLSQEGRWEQSNEGHRELVEAITRRDGTAAAAAAAKHLNGAKEIRLALWRKNPI